MNQSTCLMCFVGINYLNHSLTECKIVISSHSIAFAISCPLRNEIPSLYHVLQRSASFWDISTIFRYFHFSLKKRVISPYSVGMRENTDQEIFEYTQCREKEKTKQIFMDGESPTLIMIGNRKLFIQLLLNSFTYFFLSVKLFFLNVF